jgi:cell division protein FtsB
MSAKELLSSKIVFLCLLILLGFLANAKYKQWKNQKAIDVEKAKLIKQTQEIEKKNAELQESLSYLNSENYKERAAKEQLNLKKSGEIVFGFSDSAGAPPTATGGAADNRPNVQKWLEYFMGQTNP